jgi:hypothetical protein
VSPACSNSFLRSVPCSSAVQERNGACPGGRRPAAPAKRSSSAAARSSEAHVVRPPIVGLAVPVVAGPPEQHRAVKPATIVRWHRQGFRLFWRWRSRSGRPPVNRALRKLIREMSKANRYGVRPESTASFSSWALRLARPRSPSTWSGELGCRHRLGGASYEIRARELPRLRSRIALHHIYSDARLLISPEKDAQ